MAAGQTLLALALLLGLTTAVLPGCREKGPAEKAGEKIDDAVDDAKDGIDEAVDDLKD